MAGKSEKPAPKITLIPWDPESPEHRERLYHQRIACGWKADRIEKWSKYQKAGLMSIHWIILDASGPNTADWISKHVTEYPVESTPLQDSAIAIGGHPRDSSSSRSLEPFIPIGHISVDTIASTPDPTPLLADPPNHRFHLSALYISRAIHGGGLGNAAMAAGEHMAVSILGAKTITLDTWDRRLIRPDSKPEWAENYAKFSTEPFPTFENQTWYERLGYKVIKEIEEYDERSGYSLKIPSGETWCIPSVWMAKAVE